MKFFSAAMPFKGKRRYLHGTSILECAMEIVGHNASSAFGGRLRAIFHDVAKSELCVTLASDGEIFLRPEQLRAEVIFLGKSGDRVFLWFTETGKPIKESVPYPEETLLPQLVFSEQKVTLHGSSRFSPVETLVAMTKFVHQKFVPEVEKWFFTRLDITHPLRERDIEGLSVELQSRLANLSRARILARNEELGVIYFSANEK